MSRKKQGVTTRNSVVYSRGDSAFISVYCEGSTEGAHERWRIASFTPSIHENQIVWMPSSTGYHDPASTTLQPLAGDVTQYLDGNAWLSKRKDERPRQALESPGFRIRWLLRCRECGLAKVIAHPADHYVWMTLLAHSGSQELTLSTFARLVDQQAERTRKGTAADTPIP